MNLSEAVHQSNSQIQSGQKVHRPTFETSNDRRNQQEIADAVARLRGRGLRAQALKTHSVVDFALVRDIPNPDGSRGTAPRIMAWLECKHRHIMKGQYKTLILSMHKWIDGLNYSKATNKPFVFAVRFKDNSIHYIKIDKTPAEMGYEVVLGGRASRKGNDGATYFDPDDIEFVIHIPMTDLIALEPEASAPVQDQTPEPLANAA
jgi:hypothetical protein